MFTLNDNSNKPKVAFYVALVILLITLGQCQSQLVDATEVISHSSPKNTSTDVSVIRGYAANKGISEKLTEIRQLLRSLIFDWNLGESETQIGRTFGRIRMMKNILLPVAFIGGFLTAVIFSIKAIGVVNLILISSLLALNLAMIIGKLFYLKKFGGHGQAEQTHYHSHYNHQYPSYGSYHPYGSYQGSYSSSYGHADSRADQNSLFGRDLNQQPSQFGLQVPGFPHQGSSFPLLNPINSGFNSQSSPFSNENQASQNFNQPFINSQNPTALNSLNQPQQPPTNFRPQMNTIPQNIDNIGNNPFNDIQIQSPQQVQQQQPTSNSFNQPLNQQLSSQMQDLSFLSNDIVTTVPTFEVTTTPRVDAEMINLQEIKPQSSFSPLEMEKILTNALARISESRRGVSATALPNRFRFKRKSTNHQPKLNLLRPFS